MDIYNDKEDNSSTWHNTLILYVYTKLESTKLCKAITNRTKGRNWQEHIYSRVPKYPTNSNG